MSDIKHSSIVLSSLVAIVILSALVLKLFKCNESNPLKWQIMQKYYVAAAICMIFNQLLAIPAVIADYGALKAISLTEQAYWNSLYLPIMWTSYIFLSTTCGIWIFASFERFKRVFHIEDNSTTARFVRITKVLVVIDCVSTIIFYSWYYFWNQNYVDGTHQRLQAYIGASLGSILAIIDFILSISMTHKVLSSLKNTMIETATNISNEELHSRYKIFRLQLISLFFFLISLDVIASTALFLDMSAIANSVSIIHIFLTFYFLNLLKRGVLMVRTPSRIGTAKASAKVQVVVTELPSVKMNSILSEAPVDLCSSSRMF